jgi:undecaprenyl-phosphate 4-deoxy-4-formamido-L-arabinose transferase
MAQSGWYAISALHTQIWVPSHASIIVAVLVLGGFQLLSLGIKGEHVGRLHLKVNCKQQLNVQKRISNETHETTNTD